VSHRLLLATLLAVTCALLASACGGTDTADAARVTPLKAPAALAQRGTLVFCSDIGYPPQEFMDDSGTPAGADIEIGRALANRLDLKVQFANRPFDGIIDDLGAKKCDAIISAMTDNAERRADVTFVDYLRTGQSLLVSTANEFDIQGLTDLGGHTVAVQAGTTNESFLRDQVKHEQWGTAGAPKLVTFQDDADAAQALADGKADAYYGDSPTAAYYIGQAALTYAFAGKPINPEPIGIAVRPTDKPLARQLQLGIDGMYADGTMATILGKWKLEDFALKG
jgi:polar amino acid transport system substrate-binding protein